MALCDRIREISYAIHVYHGNGYLERVYENALVNRLRKAGFAVKQQHPITIYDEDGTVIGEYFADVIVEDCLLIELKACKKLTDEHTSRLLHYLKATGIEHGLMINFGSYRFELQKSIRSQPHDLEQERPSLRSLCSLWWMIRGWSRWAARGGWPTPTSRRRTT